MKKLLRIFLKTSIVLCFIFVILMVLAYTPIPTYLGIKRGCIGSVVHSLDYYAQESPDVVKYLSENEIVSKVELIRDSLLFVEDPFPGVERLMDYSEQKNRIYYFGYQSTLPGIDYQKAWTINYGSASEVPFDEYLKVWESPLSPDLPYAVYSIHFFEVDFNSLLCVMVSKKLNFEFYMPGRRWSVEVWDFNNTFPGK